MSNFRPRMTKNHPSLMFKEDEWLKDKVEERGG